MLKETDYWKYDTYNWKKEKNKTKPSNPAVMTDEQDWTEIKISST